MNVSILFLLVIVSVLLHTDDCMYINARGRKHQSLHYPARRFPSIPSCVLDASATTATTTDSKKIFWSDGLKFECTACGKCCRNDGEVWLDTDEFAALCDHLQKTPQEVLLAYSDTVMNGWVKLRNKVSDPTNAETKEGDSCIFLDNDGKKCTIYDARPIQVCKCKYMHIYLFLAYIDILLTYMRTTSNSVEHTRTGQDCLMMRISGIKKLWCQIQLLLVRNGMLMMEDVKAYKMLMRLLFL